MDTESLRFVREFDALDPGLWCPHCPKPTAASLSRVEAHFGIALPPLLIALARGSRHFGRRFASLGTDYDSPLHIIRINSHWRRRRRTRRVPRGFVIVTNEHDDRHWCLDTNEPADGDDRYPLQFWTPDPLIYASESHRPRERYPDFTRFLSADIHWHRWHARRRT